MLPKESTIEPVDLSEATAGTYIGLVSMCLSIIFAGGNLYFDVVGNYYYYLLGKHFGSFVTGIYTLVDFLLNWDFRVR